MPRSENMPEIRSGRNRNPNNSSYVREQLERAFKCLDEGVCISSLIAEDEATHGRVVIRPGGSPWLPESDWEPGTVCSINGKQIRLILLHAKNPGTGAFTRMVSALRERWGDMIYVIAPTIEFQAALRRAGWRLSSLNGEMAMRAPRTFLEAR